MADCPVDRQRCSDTTTECVPLADFCDGITDCANGIDEQGCDVITGCLNDRIRVDGDINTCDCGVRYAGERCETDLGECTKSFTLDYIPVHVLFQSLQGLCIPKAYTHMQVAAPSRRVSSSECRLDSASTSQRQNSCVSVTIHSVETRVNRVRPLCPICFFFDPLFFS